MPDPSTPNPHLSNEGTTPNTENLNNEEDFWSLDTNKEDLSMNDASTETLQTIAENRHPYVPVNSLSEEDLMMDLPDADQIKSSLDIENPTDPVHEIEHQPETIEQSATRTVAAAVTSINKPEITSNPVNTAFKKNAPRSNSEKLASLICGIAIISIFVYLITYASDQHNFDTEKDDKKDTSASGSHASISSIETWWSEPTNENTKLRVSLIPSATITLNSDSKSGAIRTIFYSTQKGSIGEFKPVGDQFTHEFADGKFLETGTDQITIYATDGLKELSHFYYFREQSEDRWTISILEASEAKTSMENFQILKTTPISSNRK